MTLKTQMLRKIAAKMDDSANKLRKSSRKQLQSNKSTTDTPTFKPDAKMGEGTASDTELSFRKALIDLNQPIYDTIIKGIKENEGSLTKQLAIVDEQTALLFKQGTPIILATDESMVNDFVSVANSNLKKITPTIKQIKPDITNDLTILQHEQIDDWKNICDDINYKIKSGLRRQTLTNNLHKKPTPSTKAISKHKKPLPNNDDDDDDINSAFNQAQQRQDGLGWYGYSQASLIGLHGTYFNAIAAGLVIGSGGAIVSDLVADWVSQGDEAVCDDCLDLEAGGPYSIFNWPEDPHFGCRCYQSAPYVLSATDTPNTLEETESPDSGVPITETPETQMPETESPDVEVPITEAQMPETDVPETSTTEFDPRVEGTFNPEKVSNLSDYTELTGWDEKLTNVSNSQLDSLSDYKHDGFKPINDYLREGTLPETGELEDLNQNINELDTVIDDTKTPTDLVLYRGLGDERLPDGTYTSVLDNDLPEGTIIDDSGFQSATTSLSTANAYGGHSDNMRVTTILRIAYPKGSPGVPVSEMLGLNDRSITNKGEQEILLPRGENMKYEVIGSKTYGKGTFVTKAINVRPLFQ